MQAGGGDSDAITDINVTPLVDISLVLVIIFMVAAPMVIQSGLVVNASKVTASHGKSTKDEAIQLKLTEKGIIVNNKRIIRINNNEMELFYSPEEPESAAAEKKRKETRAKYINYMKKVLARNKKKLLMITSDRGVKHVTMVWALDASKQAGAKKLVILKEDHTKKKK